MLKGKVKFFNSAKGWGFILVEGQEVFAHYKNITGEGFKSLRENQIVFVESIGDSPKGKYAIGITPAVPDPINFEDDRNDVTV